MKLDDLRSAQVDERGTDSLQPLRPTFYEEAAAYLADLRERRNRLAEAVDDPFDSEEVVQLNNELETAKEVVESIYERRVGKLVKQASLAAAGMSGDVEGLTEEERTLYTDLVERIEANRSAMLGSFDGGGGFQGDPDREAAPEPPKDTPERSDDGALDAAEAMGTDGAAAADTDDARPRTDADQPPEPDGGSTPTAAEDDADEADRLTVRITDTVGEIYGVDDRVYTLDTEDVVTLPEANAKPLLERGAAQRVD
jgi:DNA replication factor GINS